MENYYTEIIDEIKASLEKGEIEEAEYREMFADFVSGLVSQNDTSNAFEEMCGSGSKEHVVKAVHTWCKESKETRNGQ